MLEKERNWQVLETSQMRAMVAFSTKVAIGTVMKVAIVHITWTTVAFMMVAY